MSELPNIPGNRVTVYRDDDGIATVWCCPCGDWQLTILQQDRSQFVTDILLQQQFPATAPVAETINQALNAENYAIESAIWEHEAECEALQHLLVQCGLVRPESYSPYVWTPGALVWRRPNPRNEVPRV